MPGAGAGDIRHLIERGLIAVTETGAIAQVDLMNVAAVEAKLSAVAALTNRFPGMKIIRDSLESALRSDSPTAWPTGEHRKLFRADIVNLDLNTPLVAQFSGLQLEFPILKLVRKLAVLHAEAPRLDWTLCLTLHGEVLWDADARTAVCTFLAENCEREPSFAEAMVHVLGEDLAAAVIEKRADGLPLDNPVSQQALLMVCVPKRILSDVHAQGWYLSCRHNIRYGGGERAPMVSWIIDFVEDPRGATEPDKLYRECLATVLDNVARIDADGALRTLASS